jgi:hypothetical protein
MRGHRAVLLGLTESAAHQNVEQARAILMAVGSTAARSGSRANELGDGGQTRGPGHEVASPTGTGRLWYWPFRNRIQLAA